MKYEKINIGQKETLSHIVTQSDIDKFVDLTGDDNKLHVDKDFAAQTSFKKPVVHGMIGASFISTVIGTKLPGDGALWFSQTLDFLLPVRLGDKIDVVAEVVKKIDNEHIIELKIEIINQNRQIVTRGISKVKVIEPEVSDDKTEILPDTGKRTALVIGATGGIGAATCKELSNTGLDVIIHYNSNKEKALEIQKEILNDGNNAFIVQGNINSEDSINEIVKYAYRKCEHIDVFVNCASTPIPPIKFMDLLWEDFYDQLKLNIDINLSFIKKLVPQMINNKYGRIITVGSVYSNKPNVNLAHYVTAKSALEGFTKAIALELAPKGINVNMVSPSIISTDLTSDIPEKIKLMTAAQTPVRRLALPADVANAIGFLASDKSSFISGEVIRVNGGQVMI